MNVIFLDIDGVLNSPNYRDRYAEKKQKNERTYRNIDDNAISYLKKLQERYEAKIVLTSSWRVPIDKLRKSINENPITEDERKQSNANLRTLYEKLKLEYDLDFDDATVSLDGNRMLEIQLYLLCHKDIDKFVILDDDDQNLTEIFEEQFIQCCTKGDSFGKKEFEQACTSLNQQKRYVLNPEGLKQLQNYFDNLTKLLKTKAESMYASILDEKFDTVTFDISGTKYRRLYHYLPDEIRKKISIESWKNGRIKTKNERTFEQAVISNKDYFSSLMLLEAGSNSLPLYSIVIEQIEIDEKKEMKIMQELVSKLSESQKKQLLQSARKKYDELQQSENLQGSIENIKEVIQFLFNEDISNVQIEKDSELDK